MTNNTTPTTNSHEARETSLALPEAHQRADRVFGSFRVKDLYELLMTAPEEQVIRCRLAYRALLAGEYADAVVHLRNAALEVRGEWAEDARELADFLSGEIRT